MSDDAVRGLIIAHATLGAGLTAAVRQISGMGEDALRPISNEGRGPDALLELVREAVGDAPALIFTDLASGSCALAARKVAQDRPQTGIIFGTNLPVLLDFVFHRDLPLPELVDRLVSKGRGEISGICKEDTARADRALSR